MNVFYMFILVAVGVSLCDGNGMFLRGLARKAMRHGPKVAHRLQQGSLPGQKHTSPNLATIARTNSRARLEASMDDPVHAKSAVSRIAAGSAKALTGAGVIAVGRPPTAGTHEVYLYGNVYSLITQHCPTLGNNSQRKLVRHRNAGPCTSLFGASVLADEIIQAKNGDSLENFLTDYGQTSVPSAFQPSDWIMWVAVAAAVAGGNSFVFICCFCLKKKKMLPFKFPTTNNNEF